MDISFESNIDAWAKDLSDIGKRQIPFATSQALNDTAFEFKRHSERWMDRDFDRPKAFTRKGFLVEKSTKRSLVATIYSKDRREYIDTNIPDHGVKYRPHTKFERRLIFKGVMERNEWAMPGQGLKLDRFGNVSPGVYPKVLAQLQITDFAIGDETSKSRKRRVAKNTSIFIPKLTNGGRANRLPRGIWRRVGKRIEPLFIFVTKRPAYHGAFNFEGRGEEFVINRFPILFARRFDRAMATAR